MYFILHANYELVAFFTCREECIQKFPDVSPCATPINMYGYFLQDTRLLMYINYRLYLKNEYNNESSLNAPNLKKALKEHIVKEKINALINV